MELRRALNGRTLGACTILALLGYIVYLRHTATLQAQQTE